MSVSNLLTKTCTIVRKTASISANTGGNVYTWTNAATGVPCAVQISSTYQARQLLAETGVQELQCYFNDGQDVRVGDILSSITGYSIGADVTSKATDDAGRNAYVRVTAVVNDGKKYQ